VAITSNCYASLASCECFAQVLDYVIIVPSVVVFDNAKYFWLAKLTAYVLDKGIILKYHSNYYLQGNDTAILKNKKLI
jgi:hypothetical protein